MKTIWKKALAVLLVLILTAGIAPAANWLAVIAAAESVSGSCGANGGNLSWSLDTDTGVLIVSGTGDMADYDDEDNLPPWSDYIESISSVVVESGVTSIGDCAFSGFTGLTQVTIGADVARIGGDAFSLTALTEVFVPSSVEEIGPTAFVGMTFSEDDDITTTLQRIVVDPDNDTYASEDGVLYDKTKTTLIQFPCGKPATSFTVPDGVEVIGDLAFAYCVHLQALTLPDSLTEIGTMAFLYSYMIGSLTIPGNVVSFGEEAFLGCFSLESVTFADGITEIPEALFADFESLETVIIPGSVATIGAHAFAGCTSLASLTISNGVETIGENAFYGCTSLSSLSIPGSTVLIGAQAFSGCENLAALTLGSGVKTIGNNAFYGCTSLASLMIPDSVTGIGGSAFAGCSSMADLTIGSGAETIGSYAFSGCTNLSSLTFNAVNCGDLSNVFVGSSNIRTLMIGSAVTRIPAGAFVGLEHVTAVTIPNRVTSIGAQAFLSCRELADVTIGSGVETIGDYAFQNCETLESLHIPSVVTFIGADVFENCGNLAFICSDSETGYAKTYADENSIEFRLCSGHGGSSEPNTVSGACGTQGDNVTWTLDLDTYVMTISGTGEMADYVYTWDYDSDEPVLAADTPWKAYRESIRSVIVEDGVTRVGNAAFRNYDSLASVTLSDSVTTIGEWAFAACDALTDVTLSEDLTSVGAGAFADCTGLHGVTIPENVTFIGASAFLGTPLTSIYIPRSVQMIGPAAFLCCADTEPNAEGAILQTLTQIEADPDNSDFASVNGVLYDKTMSTLLQYPGGAPDTGFSIPNGVTAIGADAFYSCINLQTVTIPDSVTTIGEEAFMLCTGLSGLTLPETVKTIADSAFASCISLTQITIPDSVVTIGESAFSGCQNLTAAALGSVETIGKFALSATGLTSVVIPETILKIEGSTFAGCTSLTSIHIPYTVISISESALADCDSLSFICSDTADCYARSYAGENNIAFRLCTGHDNDAATISGICGAEGDNVLWALNLGSGKMLFSGFGSMADYSGSADTPWADHLASVQTIEIQSGVTSIGDYAFAGCVPLQSVTFGDTVTRIGTGAFAATPLTSIAVPGSVREIGADAFACGMLTEEGFVPTLRQIDVDPDSMTFFSRNGVLFNKNRTTLILYPAAADSSEYEIPGTVKRIEAGAFKGSRNLMHVHVPYSVTDIGENAFAECDALSYLCCDIAGSRAETYAADNAIPFLYCDGHKSPSGIAGDANGDGSIDLKDVILMRRYLAGGWDNIMIYGRFADVDADNAITLQDVVLIARFLAGGWNILLQ